MRGLLLIVLPTVLLLVLTAPTQAQHPSAEILVQISLTAGLRHHEAKAIWDQMQLGDALTLVREPLNPYDANAVRVEWNGRKLGYIPRAENQAVARQMDRGNALEARIAKLIRYRNHRRKLELEVYLPLQTAPAPQGHRDAEPRMRPARSASAINQTLNS